MSATRYQRRIATDEHSDTPQGVCRSLSPEIEAALDADPSVDQYSCLLEDGDANEWLYRIEYASDVEDIYSLIFSNDGTILDAECSASNWTFRLLFPERDLLSEMVSELEEQEITVDVQRMVEAGRTADLKAAAGLTEAQGSDQ